MDKNIAIKIENLSKQYRLGVVGTGTLSHDLKRWWTTNILGKEDPYLKIGEVNDRAHKGQSEYVWALKDINLEIEQGDVVGIIGKNGAGKSTLLKILSRVTKPSTGSIRYNGRIASLLEVGTGFHPEMTGRENIFMNGAIMGMTRAEIRGKLDEIVDFAGIERYLDTPVKRYSSGMTVRLGFSIAAHLEPDILVVDEVLAVGDAEFQKKAIGKMQDVSKGAGRTVLFVSHNMAAIQSLCKNGVLLDKGFIKNFNRVDYIIKEYVNEFNRSVYTIDDEGERKGNGEVRFVSAYIEDEDGNKVETLLTGQNIFFVFIIKKYSNYKSLIDIGFSIHDEMDDPLSVNYSSYQNITFEISEPNYYAIKYHYKDFNLTPGLKRVRGIINDKNELSDWPENNLFRINVVMGDYYESGFNSINPKARILHKGEWKISKIKEKIKI